MGQPLSMDLRRRLLAAIDEGMSCRAAAARFGVANDEVWDEGLSWARSFSIAESIDAEHSPSRRARRSWRWEAAQSAVDSKSGFSAKLEIGARGSCFSPGSARSRAMMG